MHEMGRRDFLKTMGSYARAAGMLSFGIPLIGFSETECSADSTSGRTREVVLSYLSQPRFSGTEFMEQITGTKASLELYDLDDGMMYFSMPSGSYRKGETLGKLSRDPGRVEFAKVKSDALVLGDYAYRNPGTYFFRFPAADFVVDSNSRISISFGDVTYTQTMEELVDFADNVSIYGGRLHAVTGRGKGEIRTVPNYGAFVARKGETSLKRLVSDIAGRSGSREEAAQRLLDFTTIRLEYDRSDALPEIEVLEKPNEVLMTRGSDCVGKVILYSSLLEQTGSDYCMVYSPHKNHITVGVEGKFPDKNGMSFGIGKKRFSIAETTARGFRIGKSRLEDPVEISDIRYLQDPGENSSIYNAATGEPLEFL